MIAAAAFGAAPGPMAASAGTAAVATQDGSGRLPTFRVETADRDPTSIGSALGLAVKARFPDLEQRWDRHLAALLSQADFDRHAPVLVESARRTGIDAVDREEIDGFASALSLVGRDQLGDRRLSANEFWYLQVASDLLGDADASGFGVFGRASADGNPVVGRNLGGDASGTLRGLQAITVYVSDRATVVALGFAGLLGVISGFNDHGLFVSSLGSPVGASAVVAGSGMVGASRDLRVLPLDLRHALQTRTQVAAAAALLRGNRYGSGSNVLIADRDEVQVLEQPARQPARLRNAASITRPEMEWGQPDRIAVVNCFVLAASPANCRRLRDRYRWQRFRELARVVPGEGGAVMGDVARIMLDRANQGYAIFGPATLQSMVFIPETTELYLYAAAPDGVQPETPVMHRYAGLDLVKPAGPGIIGARLALWLPLGAVVGAAIRLGYLAWRRQQGR